MRCAPLILVLLVACSSGSSTTPPPPPISNPVPSMLGVTPDTVLAGSPAVTITVTGTNFVSGSILHWNGQSRPTTIISGTRLTAVIPSSDVAAAATAQLTIFNPSPGGGTSATLTFPVAGSSGVVVHDATNSVVWLADANLAAAERFGLPVCTPASDTKGCINASGSMTFQAASAWVQAMNAAEYLGHTNWQLPTSPDSDGTCPFIGPHNESFGFGCMANAMGSLYSQTLGLKAPNTAVPIPINANTPFSNFQPYLYWSGSTPDSSGHGSFSFNSGFQGSNTTPNYLYLLPMIQGKIQGTPAAPNNNLQVNPDGGSVYDPVTDITWAANANLGKANQFGMPLCTKVGTPNLCVNSDGAMNWDSANQFLTKMNSGAGYLGQKNWALPALNPDCYVGYQCAAPPSTNPLGNLYYNQLGLSAGTPAGATPSVLVGGFKRLQPYLYWGCDAVAVQSPCRSTGPVTGFEWTFSFGNGFLGTDVLKNNFFVMVYFVGTAN